MRLRTFATLCFLVIGAGTTIADDNVACVQQRLVDLGFNPGPVNGETGAKTKSAATAFARQYSLVDKLPRWSIKPEWPATSAAPWCAAIMAIAGIEGIPIAPDQQLPKDVAADGSFKLSTMEVRPWSARLVGNRVRAGDQSARLELREADCESVADSSACDERTGRVVLPGVCTPAGGTSRYEWSVYLDEAWPRNSSGSDTLLATFNAPDHQLLEIFNGSNGISAYHYAKQFPLKGEEAKAFRAGIVALGNSIATMSTFDEFGYAEVPLISEGSMRGSWHDVVVQARWTSSKKGYLSITVDGKKRYHFDGATIDREADVCPFLELWRWSRWTGGPLVAWYDSLSFTPIE